ncbi:MAG: ATP-binding cassette domain-containing protein [Synergistaceae bacterium]|jgi:branched-chain amino acid transport system ATP-binding protein|nr:ATP-binding cassette domain-containing protein [Synergistaceae bacterium]
MLTVKDLVAGYSNMPAIHGISFEVKQGQIVALLGSNGAGKTTTLRAITNVIRPDSGSVTYKGKSLAGVPSYKMVELGISMIPEGRHLFPKMSVLDNLMMGAYSVKDKSLIQEKLETVYEIFPRLAERKRQLAGTMSGGE